MEFNKNRILSSELKEHTGKRITVLGWLYKKRELGNLNFLLIRDRHGLIQVVVDKKEELKKLDGLQIGTVLSATGDVVAEERAPSGVEIHNPTLEVDVPITAVSPIEIDKTIDHTPDNLNTLFENRVLNLRNVKEQKIFKIQSAVGKALREYFEKNDVLQQS